MISPIRQNPHEAQAEQHVGKKTNFQLKIHYYATLTTLIHIVACVHVVRFPRNTQRAIEIGRHRVPYRNHNKVSAVVILRDFQAVVFSWLLLSVVCPFPSDLSMFFQYLSCAYLATRFCFPLFVICSIHFRERTRSITMYNMRPYLQFENLEEKLSH